MVAGRGVNAAYTLASNYACLSTFVILTLFDLHPPDPLEPNDVQPNPAL
jgi:hypothetical protein